MNQEDKEGFVHTTEEGYQYEPPIVMNDIYNYSGYGGYDPNQFPIIVDPLDEGMNQKEAKRILRNSGYALFCMVLSVLLAQIILELVVGAINPDFFKRNWYIWVVSGFSIFVVGLSVFTLIIKKVPATKMREAKPISLVKFLMFFVICTGCGYLFNLIGVLITTILFLLTGKNILNPVTEVMMNSNIIFNIIYVGIMAPIVEELIFRKLLLDRLKRFGDIPAMLLSGIAFGLFHMNLSQFIYATVLGILYGYIALKTNRVRYVILLHMMNNLFATLMALVIVGGVVVSLISAMWVMTLIFGAITLIILNYKKIQIYRPQRPLLKAADYCLNPGWLLFYTSCLVMIIVAIVA